MEAGAGEHGNSYKLFVFTLISASHFHKVYANYKLHFETKHTVGVCLNPQT